MAIPRSKLPNPPFIFRGSVCIFDLHVCKACIKYQGLVLPNTNWSQYDFRILVLYALCRQAKSQSSTKVKFSPKATIILDPNIAEERQVPPQKPSSLKVLIKYWYNHSRLTFYTDIKGSLSIQQIILIAGSKLLAAPCLWNLIEIYHNLIILQTVPTNKDSPQVVFGPFWDLTNVQ